MEDIKYIVEEGYIYYDTETARVSIPNDINNRDYQIYLESLQSAKKNVSK